MARSPFDECQQRLAPHLERSDCVNGGLVTSVLELHRRVRTSDCRNRRGDAGPGRGPRRIRFAPCWWASSASAWKKSWEPRLTPGRTERLRDRISVQSSAVIAGMLLWFANSVISAAAVANLLMDTHRPGDSRAGLGAGGASWRLVHAVRRPRGGEHPRVALRRATVDVDGRREHCLLVLLVVVDAFALRLLNLQWIAVPAASRIGQTTVLLFFAFMGVEGALNVSGEVANPARTVPRAIFLALTLVAVLYIGLQLVAQGVLGAGLADSPAPLVAAAAAVFGPWARPLFRRRCRSAGFLSADVLCSPRNLAALAERRQLPRGLAAVHPRFKTPAIAVGVYALMCAKSRCLVRSGSSSFSAPPGRWWCTDLLSRPASASRRSVATAGPPFRAPGGSFVPLAAPRSFSGCCRHWRGGSSRRRWSLWSYRAAHMRSRSAGERNESERSISRPRRFHWSSVFALRIARQPADKLITSNVAK